MLAGLLYFLVAVLILVVVLYVAKLVMNMIELPAEVKQIAWLIIGLIALVLLILLVVNAFQVGPTDLRWR